MAKSQDSGVGNSEELETLKDLFGPLTSAVRDTVVKLIERNKGKGENSDVSLWAAQQVKSLVDHAASFTAAQMIKADEEEKRQKDEAEEQERMKKEMTKREEASREKKSPDGRALEDHGTGAIAYPWRKRRKLGRGGFGVVYHAVDKTGFDFAVKEVERHRTEADRLKDEIACLSKLSHENIVRYFGFAKGRGRIFMYLELMAGSIRDKMDKEKKPLDVDLARKYTRHVTEGLVYLHSENIVHRDVKCANVLLDDKDVAKLADMGLSKTHEQKTLLQYDDTAGTILWMSPEAMTKHTAGKRADVWSLGCTVYEMIKFGPPFHDFGTLGFMLGPLVRIQAGKLEHRRLVDEDQKIAGSVKSFLKQIFVNLENRPYAQDVAQHKWLLDW